MRLTLFAHVSAQYNPYIALLRQAVQPYCAEPVTVRRRFAPGWVWAEGRPGDVAHLHWIEKHLNPPPWFHGATDGWRAGVNRLGDNRLTHPLRTMDLLARLSLALTLARRRGLRVVYTVHNLVAHHERGDIYRRLDEMANRLILSRADVVHVHSQAAAEAVAQAYGRRARVVMIPHGNYLGWYPNTLSRTEARRQLGLPEGAFTFVFLGQIAAYKGLEALVDAFRQLDDPSTRLVIAGKVDQPEYGDALAAFATAPGLLYRPGFVPDEAVQVYLKAADAVVLPYQRITTSGSALLALSFGRPIIAPDLSFLAEVVPPTAGRLYPAGVAGALAEALRAARGQTWSEAAILAHARQFDWSRIGRRWAQVYTQELGLSVPVPEGA